MPLIYYLSGRGGEGWLLIVMNLHFIIVYSFGEVVV